MHVKKFQARAGSDIPNFVRPCNKKKKHHKLAFWSMVENHLENNTIRCKQEIILFQSDFQPWPCSKQDTESIHTLLVMKHVFQNRTKY